MSLLVPDWARWCSNLITMGPWGRFRSSRWNLIGALIWNLSDIMQESFLHNARPPAHQMCTHRSKNNQKRSGRHEDVTGRGSDVGMFRRLTKRALKILVFMCVRRSSPRGGGWLIIIVQMGHGCHYFWSHDCIHRACFPLFSNLGRQWGYSDGGTPLNSPPSYAFVTQSQAVQIHGARTRTRPWPQTQAWKGRCAERRYKTGIFLNHFSWSLFISGNFSLWLLGKKKKKLSLMFFFGITTLVMLCG